MSSSLLNDTKFLLSKLVSYESFVGTSTNDQIDILDFTLNYCEEKGFLTKKVSNLLGWAELGTGKTLIAFPVHLDVVPPGGDWFTDPFKLAEIDNVLYGRGVYDNKGPAAMMITLVKKLEDLIKKENSRIRIIFGTKEETGMDCIKEYVADEEMPKLGFVPDALFPAVIGEKGRLHLILECKEEIEWIRKISAGYQVNSVPDSCEILLSNKKYIKLFEDEYSENSEERIFQEGKSAHASTPEKGKNALFLMLDRIKKENLSIEMKNIIHLKKENLFSSVDKVFGKTTINLGVCRYENNTWHIELDIRYGTSEIPKEIVNKIKHLLPNWEIEIESEKEFHLVEDLTLTEKLIEIYCKETSNSEDKIPMVIGGGTYASYFPNFISFGPKFKDIRTYGHGPNEQMSIEVLEKTLVIYEEAIKLLIEEGKKIEI